jgi:hypothetical protein
LLVNDLQPGTITNLAVTRMNTLLTYELTGGTPLYKFTFNQVTKIPKFVKVVITFPYHSIYTGTTLACVVTSPSGTSLNTCVENGNPTNTTEILSVSWTKTCNTAQCPVTATAFILTV